MLRFIELHLVPLTSLQPSSLLPSSENYYEHVSAPKCCSNEGEVRTGQNLKCSEYMLPSQLYTKYHKNNQCTILIYQMQQGRQSFPFFFNKTLLDNVSYGIFLLPTEYESNNSRNMTLKENKLVLASTADQSYENQ